MSDRPKFQPLGLDHVVLRVADQAASRKFYEDVLGCTLEFVNEPIRLVQLRFGEALIDLLPAEGPRADVLRIAEESWIMTDSGLSGASARSGIRRGHGYRWRAPPPTRPGGP